MLNSSADLIDLPNVEDKVQVRYQTRFEFEKKFQAESGLQSYHTPTPRIAFFVRHSFVGLTRTHTLLECEPVR